MKTSAILDNSLDTQISNTNKSISTKTEELLKLKADLKQFSDANFNLNIAISQDVDKNNLSPTELLAEIERLQTLENARLQKLGNVKKAKMLFESQISQVEANLKSLKNTLNYLNDEKDWTENYLPKANQYNNSFVAEFKAENDKRINDCNQRIKNYQNQLEKIQYFLNNPDPNQKIKSCKITDTQSLSYPDAEQALSTIPQHIESLETSIKLEQNAFQQRLDSLSDDQQYRSFIRARVEIEPIAQNLRDAAENYAKALAEFKSLAEECQDAIKTNRSFLGAYENLQTCELGDFIEICDLPLILSVKQ